ncbi:MAG: hypothetical protein JWL99_1066 [Streptomyces oryziradicis]|nr:hypothetical protein [Actinacidiphila oryziradicis]
MQVLVLVGDGWAVVGCGDGEEGAPPEADGDAPPGEAAEVAEIGTGEPEAGLEAVAVPLAEALGDFLGVGLREVTAEASDSGSALSLGRPLLLSLTVAGSCDAASEAAPPE